MSAIESLPAAAATRQALQQAHLDVTVRDLDAVVAVSYRFRNAESGAIEALFTFPMPRSAAFIGLTAEIGGETIAAQVIEARAAMRRYDDALSDGDSALLLRQLAPGLLQASLGNLGPGEEAHFTLRYAMPLSTLDRRVRLRLPMGLRPRYGSWDLDELDEPVQDAGVEYALSVSVRIEGFLTQASVACPSHPARFVRRGEAAELNLIDAWLDGDVVVEFGLDAPLAPRGEIFPDGEGFGARVNLLLPFSEQEQVKPLQTTLLLDCSGSMEGDAILGCRAALEAVANALTEEDRLQVMRFGNDVHALLRRPIRVGPAVRRSLLELAGCVQADLGGTEMGQAIERALDGLAQTRDPECAQAIFLITDGAIQPRDIEDAMQRAIDEQVRVFVVAVGSSASVETLEPLAVRTLGQLEHVMPGEAIAEAVLRQLRRMRQQSPMDVGLRFDTGDVPVQVQRWAYAGDAVACHQYLPAATARVRVSCALWSEPLDLPLAAVEASPDRLTLLGLARYSAASDEDDQRELAVHYRLLTQYTSAILVKHRVEGEQFEELPQIRPQAQMRRLGKASAKKSVQPGNPRLVASARRAAAPDADDGVDCMALPTSLRRAQADEAAPPAPEAAPEPPRPQPAQQSQALRALRHALLQILDESAPKLARAALLARLPNDLRDIADWLLREELEITSDADWLGLLDALASCDADVPLDEVQQDRLATALLLAGYGGRPDEDQEDLCMRIERLLET